VFCLVLYPRSGDAAVVDLAVDAFVTTGGTAAVLVEPNKATLTKAPVRSMAQQQQPRCPYIGMVRNAAGVCACRPGMVLRGSRCMAETAQQPRCPYIGMVRDAAGACACRPGMVLRGSRCMAETAQQPRCPYIGMVRDAAGACACRPGMVLRGSRCVAR
jgi:hypothetical protein